MNELDYRVAIEALENHVAQTRPIYETSKAIDYLKKAHKEALAQPEQEKERCVGCEACIDTACGRDECPKGWPKAVQPEQEPVLQDIEQYRLQMAGISTAAIGYWKKGDGIHPDYDTLALRDVAKLYAKYDALYKSNRLLIESLEKIVGYDLPDENAIVEVARAALEKSNGIKE